jgi:hypothetical protein
MSMSNPVEATLALDALPIGSQIVACGVEEDGTAYGVLYEHMALSDGRRYWKQPDKSGSSALIAKFIIDRYDDMVICRLGLPASTTGSTKP